MGYSGNGLGGSSAINFLCWIKPPTRDIDGESGTRTKPFALAQLTWRQLPDIGRLGNTGWNWENFAKCLERTEGYLLSDRLRCTVLTADEILDLLNHLRPLKRRTAYKPPPGVSVGMVYSFRNLFVSLR